MVGAALRGRPSFTAAHLIEIGSSPQPGVPTEGHPHNEGVAIRVSSESLSMTTRLAGS
jgi:hypothetical protein